MGEVLGTVGEKGVGVCLKNSLSRWEVWDWEPDNLSFNSRHTPEWPTRPWSKPSFLRPIALCLPSRPSGGPGPLKTLNQCLWALLHLLVPTLESFLGPFSRSVPLSFRSPTLLPHHEVLDHPPPGCLSLPICTLGAIFMPQPLV